jgi:hypothetical protein
MRPAEYAEYRETTPSAISMAIKRGKIFKNKDGWIDVEQADSMYTPQYNGTMRGQRTDLAMKNLDQGVSSGVKPFSTTTNDLVSSPDDIDSSSFDEMDDVHADNMAQLSGQDPPSGAKPRGAEAIFTQSRAFRETMRAERERMELAKERGELISLESVRETVTKISRHNRDAWMGWPDDVAVHLAAQLKVDPKTFRDVLHEAVRRHLEDVANLSFDDITDPA